VSLLRSAVFRRLVVSSLLVVAVLGAGLFQSTRAHERLDAEFERLVQHDLQLADDAEVMLRLMLDLKAAVRYFLIVGDASLVRPFEQVRRELERKVEEARAVAEPGPEDALIGDFSRDLAAWIASSAEPRIAAKRRGEVTPAVDPAGDVIAERMRVSLSRPREDAVAAAELRERRAVDATDHARASMVTSIVAGIVIALGSGLLIARDTARAAEQVKQALDATGRLEPFPDVPPRRDEFGEVAARLRAVAELLRQKDASLRATLLQREDAVRTQTHAQAERPRTCSKLTRYVSLSRSDSSRFR
jgi:CHASE3 domain sensor protein